MAEGARARRRAVIEAIGHLPGGRRVLHAAARMVDGTPCHRGRGRAAGSRLERAAVHGREQEFPAARRSGRVRDQPARRRRHQPGGDRAPGEPRRQRRTRAGTGGRVHADDNRRRPGEHAQPRRHLRAAAPRRRSRTRPVRDHERRALRGSSAAHVGIAHLGTGNRGDRRRRVAERRRAVPRQRARFEDAGRHRPQARRRVGDGARRGRSRHLAERRQAGAPGPGRSAQGGRPRRPDQRCGRRRSTAGRGRPGHDLQRRQRTIRGAPPCACR